ncbi:HD-GYP domain-containing protein [Bacillus horti]|uniref:HD-GYP domain-containing protein (C-di-GMP phosphodiesterase class II) n=1 Tax=Caldalkalibacillus horti TaxID=77523 RepID=A0ABT9W1Y9_9BACI|nr:HD-GYP domain-containing protein [Bacillus horti]MDQ0167089.1 HD-GYP domain-containing protein (c-di-GMP phosphodiesterase class II) [Bacillus horti]
MQTNKKKKLAPQQYKPGLKLAEPVVSPNGNELFQSGYLLSKNDIKVLHAFLIPHIAVEAKDDTRSDEIDVDQFRSIDQVFIDIYSITSAQTEKLFTQFKNGTMISFHHIEKNVIPFIEYGLQHSPSIIVDFFKLIKMEKYLYQHSLLVSLLVGLIAHRSGMGKQQVFEAALSGYLHNVGKLFVDENILNKAGVLTESELHEVQKHTHYGYEFLKKMPHIPEDVLVGVAQHHEREDGSGYPYATKSESIHNYAKIIAIADIYVAMCAKRIYRQAHSPFVVAEQIKNDSFGKLDPRYTHYFLTLIAASIKVGKKVVLNNGWVGNIVYIDAHELTRPVVNCEDKIIDLQLEREYYIQSVI